LIDGFLEKVSRVQIANEQPAVLDLHIVVENGFAAVFASTANPCRSRAIAGMCIALSMAVGEIAAPRAPETVSTPERFCSGWPE
jgi:hypothetical protein